MNLEGGGWSEFKNWVDRLRGDYRHLLFRGQGDSHWLLETTLERAGEIKMPARKYYELIVGRVRPAVATHTGMAIPAYDSKVASDFDCADYFFHSERFPAGELYRYMVYLRHHGFPSPLLDWSESPYVGAFFAFRGENSSSKERSIYAFCERPEGVKGGTLGEPTIRTLGHYVTSHVRHFQQRSLYTVCESFEGSWRFDSHQYVFDNPRPRQDLLFRFDIDSAQRERVLRELNDYNLNAYSLLGSEEALLETMWLQEHVMKKPTV